MAYFQEMSDEFTAETNPPSKERDVETSDFRPSVSLHRKSPEKSKSKPMIRIGRRRPGDESSVCSSNQSNSSLKYPVSKRPLPPPPPSASATPHRTLNRYVKVYETSSAQSDIRHQQLVQAKSDQIMANIQMGKKAQTSSLMITNNKENHIPQPRLVNSTKVAEKPPDFVAAPKTPRQTLLTSLDDFSPSPVVRREPQEGIVLGYFSPDVDPPDSEGHRARQLPESVPPALARTSTGAVQGVAAVQSEHDLPDKRHGQTAKNPPQSRSSGDATHDKATENKADTKQSRNKSPTPQLISDTPTARPINKKIDSRTELRADKSTSKKVPPKTKVGQNKSTRQTGRKKSDIIDDASVLEEETPTFQKTPARFVNKEKRGVKRNKLKDKLDTHEEKVDEETEDDNERYDEEPPKKKPSPANKTTNKPHRTLMTRESDADEWFGPLPPRAMKPSADSARARLDDATADSARARLDDENEAYFDTGANKNVKNNPVANINTKNSSSDTNFKKPLLPVAKKKARTKKGVEPSQEENEERNPGQASKDNPRNGKEAKPSASAKVGEKRKAEVPQEELMEKRYLNKWVPLLRNKKLYIEGDLINFDSVTPSDMSSKWITSKITSRISDKQMGTKKTCYVLEGQLAIPAPGDRPVPLFVIDKFKNGFPENWKNIIQHWIHFNDQTMVTEATNQTILNNISSMTMTLFNSTPMPGMMSNINISNMSCIPDASRLSSKTPVWTAEPPPSSNVTSLENRVEDKSPEKQKSGEGGSGRKNEQGKSVQNRVPEIEISPEKQKSKLAAERKGRSKVVKETVNRSTKNKSVDAEQTKNNSSTEAKNKSNTAVTTITVDGVVKYPCEHCDYVGVQLRYLNVHKRKHKGLETTRSHSNSKVVKSKKPDQAGTSNRSLSESSVADMRQGILKNKQAIVNISNVNNSAELIKSRGRSKSKASKDETTNEKEGYQLEARKPSRGRGPSSGAKISNETCEPDMSQNKTMSLLDFSKLTLARNYQNTKMVQRQKFYLCEFCDFQCTNFKGVKDHLKKFHVDCENNEPDVAPPKNFSPSPQLTKPQSKSPFKRKAKSKTKSPPVKSYGELFQAAHGQQEKSAKKSRFGRLQKKNTSFNRTSWVDVTPSPDVHELQVAKAKKQASAKASAKKLPITKRNISQKSTKGKQVNKKIAEEYDEVISKPASKPVKKVQNPFRVDGAGDRLTQITTKDKESFQNLKANPKSVKDRIRNAAILKDFNGDHEDDMFGISAKVGPKGDSVQVGTLGLLGSLDDSASDNDISVHSNRTPITKYMGKSWGNDVITPSLGLAKTPSDGSDIQRRNGFESEAFIHKKVIENKKEARDKSKKKLKSVLKAAQTDSQLQSEVEESTRIIDDMVMDRNNTEAEDDEDVDDDYFDEEEEEDGNFSCDPNSALLKLYKERELKRKKQNVRK